MPDQGSFSLGDRWAAQPLRFVFLWTMVLSGGLFGAWTWAAAPEEGMREPFVAVLSGAVFGLLLGACLTWLQHSTRKKSGFAEMDHHGRLVLVQALRTGCPPADPSFHSVLRRLVAYNLDQAGKGRRAMPVAFGFLLALSVVNTVFLSRWFLLLVLWFVVLGVCVRVVSGRAEVRLAGLERALAEQESP
jgi:Flp pilus assembly protein TadB